MRLIRTRDYFSGGLSKTKRGSGFNEGIGFGMPVENSNIPNSKGIARTIAQMVVVQKETPASWQVIVESTETMP
ncbi:MAG: hypothetical protein GXP52_00635 [Deltaproteobacteria bacterium]|nr:hypothetical protein [Deltaproteobacteria bacterium]